MKKFETPIVEIEKFDMVDVITTSECPDDAPACDNQTDIL